MASRREWLASMGTLATLGFGAGINQALGVDDANNPAANVTDRTTTIKITRLTQIASTGRLMKRSVNFISYPLASAKDYFPAAPCC